MRFTANAVLHGLLLPCHLGTNEQRKHLTILNIARIAAIQSSGLNLAMGKIDRLFHDNCISDACGI
jgi:hypothetical protein